MHRLAQRVPASSAVVDKPRERRRTSQRQIRDQPLCQREFLWDEGNECVGKSKVEERGAGPERRGGNDQRAGLL